MCEFVYYFCICVLNVVFDVLLRVFIDDFVLMANSESIELVAFKLCVIVGGVIFFFG